MNSSENKKSRNTVFVTLLIIIAIFVFIRFSEPQRADAAWYTSGGLWTNRKTIDIDYQKVATTTGSNITNFPMLFSVADSDLKSTGNGGKVGQTDGGDILFTSSDGSTKLSHEIELYTATTGKLVAWVNIPFLSSTSTTRLYIYYGDASVANQWDTADGSNDVWDSNHVLVLHMTESGTTINDSTSNLNNATTTGTTVDSTTFIGNARDFDGINDQLSIASAASINNLTQKTMSAWIRKDTDNNMQIFAKSGDNATWGLITASAATASSRFRFRHKFDVSNADWNTVGTLATGVAHIAMTYNNSSSTNDPIFYLNGIKTNLNVDTNGSNTAGNDSNDYLLIGLGVSQTQDFDGVIDEVKLSNTIRSADWIKTEYRNQSSPSTFYAYGMEEQPNRTSAAEKVRNGGTANLTNPSVKVRGGVKFR